MSIPEQVTLGNLRRRLLSGGGWALIAKILGTFLALFSNIILARILPPEAFGTYILGLSILSFGITAGTLGLNQVAVRFIAENLESDRQPVLRAVLRSIFGLGAAGAITLALVLLLAMPLLANRLFNSPGLASVGGLLAGWIVVAVLEQLIAESFRGFHDIRNASLFSGSRMGLSASIILAGGLAILWVMQGETSLLTVVWLAFLAGASSTLLGFLLLARKVSTLPQGGGSPPSRLTLMRVARPLLMYRVSLYLLVQSDIWILSAMQPQSDVAIYGTALRLVHLVVLPLAVVNAVVPPFIVQLYAAGQTARLERLLRTATTLIGVPSALGLAVLMAFGGQVMGWLFGDFFRDGATIIVILCLGKLVNAWSGSCGLVLSLTGHESTFMRITVSTSIATVAFGIWATSQYGGVGLATAISAGIAVQNGLKLIYARRLTGIWTHASFSPALLRSVFSRT